MALPWGMSSQKATAGLWTCVSLVGANMIGTGVFTSLGFQLQAFSSSLVILLLWLTGGIFALCGALSYAEVAARLPRSGGEYHFLGRLYHPAFGVMAGILSIVAGFSAPVALASLAFGSYLAPVFQPMGVTPLWSALILVWVVAGVHCIHLNASKVFQNVFSFLKLLLILAFATAGMWLGRERPDWTPQADFFSDVFSQSFAVSLMFALYAYSGWNAATYILGEIKDPQRTIGRALVMGTVIVTLLYVALNASFLFAAPMDLMEGKIEIGSIVAESLFGPSGAWISGLLIGLGLVSCVSAMMWTGPRVCQVMGEDYRAFAWLSRCSRNGLPVRGTLLQALLVTLLMVTATFESVLVFTQFSLVSCSALVVAGIFRLRWKSPKTEKIFLCWGYPFTPFLFLAICGFTLIYALMHRPTESLCGLGLMIAGLLAYYPISWYQARR
jgi:APA family basic amino acid/polyamine antiporter